jgi:hypothetical protein
MTVSAMVAEFDDVSGWTADAVERLGERYAIPAACRGSANSAALAWPAEAGELRPGSVDAAWCLGVLDAVRGKAAVLREIHRVLPPGAALGLLVIVARDLRVAAPETTSSRPGGGSPSCSTPRGPTWSSTAGPPTGPCRGRGASSGSPPTSRVCTGPTARMRSRPEGESSTRLFAAGQISMQLVHATRRPAGRPSERSMCGGQMSTPTGDEFEIEFEAEVETELELAEASEPVRAAAQPTSEWLFDPAEVEAEEVELRNLLGAAEELGSDLQSRGRRPGEGA